MVLYLNNIPSFIFSCFEEETFYQYPGLFEEYKLALEKIGNALSWPLDKILIYPFENSFFHHSFLEKTLFQEQSHSFMAIMTKITPPLKIICFGKETFNLWQKQNINDHVFLELSNPHLFLKDPHHKKQDWIKLKEFAQLALL